MNVEIGTVVTPIATDPAKWIVTRIREFIAHDPANHLADAARERAFDAPLVGFASGADPLFADYKQHVGPFHWTPLEIFSLTFPDAGVPAEALTVIAWILPHTRATKADNRRATRFPAERWARARVFGEQVNVKLRQHVARALNENGIPAVAPMLSPRWERRTSDRHGYASLWSERHAAYACGLGTFGLSDGLITPLGKAMRTGSVVAHLSVAATPRPYTDPHAWCLFFTDGRCGKCMDRCPAGAITETGHDKVRCKAYMRGEVKPYIESTYGFEGRGCGLCQTKVPCESGIPVKKKDHP